MNGNRDDVEDVSEDEMSEDELSEDDVLDDVEDDDDDDNVGDLSVEINVQELIRELEKTSDEDVHRRAEIRRRLEEIRERREDELDSTFNFNLDDDV